MADQKQNQSEREKFYEEYPWPDGQTRSNMPHVNWEFGQARDPHLAKEMRDQHKTEAQRRGESEGRNSCMVGKDKPFPRHRPKGDMSKSADARAFNTEWLKEKRDAAFAESFEYKETQKQIREHDRENEHGHYDSISRIQDYPSR